MTLFPMKRLVQWGLVVLLDLIFIHAMSNAHNNAVVMLTRGCGCSSTYNLHRSLAQVLIATLAP